AVNDQDVVIVGGGPVGLTAALALHHQGINCVVIEADEKDEPKVGSRAIYIHSATLELLEQVSKGLGFKLARNGIIWPVIRTLYKGKEVYVRDYGITDNQDPHKLPHFTSLHQNEIEKYLYNACVTAGIKFVYGDGVEKLDITDEGVKVTTVSGTEWKAKYVFGCDGARSVVREQAGLKLEGPRTHDTFLVVDLEEYLENPLPLERIFHYQHPALGARNV